MKARTATTLAASAIVLMPVLLAFRGFPRVSPRAASDPRPTPTLLWGGLLQQTPIPVSTPLPEPELQPLDGTYARDDPSWPHWWACRRCADYRSTGGIWRLHLDRGVLRILHDVTGWRNLASYTIDGDRLTLFNDPVCPWDPGVYTWVEGSQGLVLSAMDDPCAFGLRAENLARQPWSDCQPPDLRAAVSDAWPRPAACEPSRPIPPGPEVPAGWQVGVYAGDVRHRDPPPRIVVPANRENQPPPAGMDIEASERIIRYGLNLILWRDGDWIEWIVTAQEGILGVQFWGPSSMGAARVLVDGREVWRGAAADLGEDLGQYGGYVEVTGITPGLHRLRVEHLRIDARPVTVLLFGLD